MEAATLPAGEVLLRVVIAGLLGGLVGLEREFSDQPAGFRTHILVSLGAALFTLVGAYGVHAFVQEDGDAVRLDPTRVAAQVVTGIGFLGAGAILRQGLNVRGLTTAAALWVTAAVGTAVALGYWTGAVATTALTVGALYGLKRMQRYIFPRLRQGRSRFVIEIRPDLRLSDLAEIAESFQARIDSMRIVEDEEEGRLLIVHTTLPPTARPEQLALRLRAVEGVASVEWRT